MAYAGIYTLSMYRCAYLNVCLPSDMHKLLNCEYCYGARGKQCLSLIRLVSCVLKG